MIGKFLQKHNLLRNCWKYAHAAGRTFPFAGDELALNRPLSAADIPPNFVVLLDLNVIILSLHIFFKKSFYFLYESLSMSKHHIQ